MKKRVLMLLGAAVMALSLGACKDKKKSEEPEQQQTVQQTFTVAFEVDGTRVATARVKDGEKVTQQIDDPVKTGYVFIGWYEGETKVDLATYVVTHNVTLVAKFEEFRIPEYNINETKNPDKTYYLVVGWWECTDFQEDGVTPKLTSHLTPETVRLFYYNLRNYLTTIGATEENLAAVTFRNYSSTTVAIMGTAINADADVDLVIGVGNNINSTAGVALHNSSNDYKFATEMGDPLTSRTVACPASASDFGVATFEWLRDTQAGKDAFKKVLTQAEIDASLVPEVIDLTVTVHGDGEPVSTHLQDRDTPVTMPEITVAPDKVFKGFALSNGGAVALNVAKNATLKYGDFETLLAENQTAIDLYPVLEDAPQQDKTCKVYIQVNGSNLTEPEAKLLKGRFLSTLAEDESATIEIVNANADNFESAVNTAGDVDVLVGGNSPLNRFTATAEGPLANAGAKHFVDTSRKVEILNTANSRHLDFAKKFYDFVIADAVELEFHYTYWHKNHTWVTTEEIEDINEAIEDNLNHFFGFNTPDQYKSTYNIVVNKYEATNTGVADLGTETRALREGKGTDLIIGCGGNVASTGGMTLVEDAKDIPTTIVANNRKIGLCNENPLARYIYDIFDNLYEIYA